MADYIETETTSSLNLKKIFGVFTVVTRSGLKLTYEIPEKFKNLQYGQLILVSIGHKNTHNTFVCVFSAFCEKPTFNCKEILNIHPLSLSLKENQLRLISEVSQYYLSAIEDSYESLAPGFIWNFKKISALSKNFNLMMKKSFSQEIDRDPAASQARSPQDDLLPLVHAQHDNMQSKVLNTEQENAVNYILSHLTESILLFGVTGSGKTEVYIKVAEKIIEQQKTVLILVPEIALTTQMTVRFKKAFGEQCAVFHSALSAGKAMQEWSKIYLNQVSVVLGVRSAVFCPLENLGLIIVDEEHDVSYKSSDMPCYHARDVAVMRAKIEKSCCILGSGTPSIESYYNVKFKKYLFIQLKNKFSSTQETTQIIVDAKSNLTSKIDKNKTLVKSSSVKTSECEIQTSIIEQIQTNKNNGFQSMVIVNRRGFVNYCLCMSCKSALSCPNCSVSTTLHDFGKTELCHYCGYKNKTRLVCPTCFGTEFIFRGVGTQNIEESLNQKIPGIKICRIDRDTLTSGSRLDGMITDFQNQKIDCLVGTQVLTKGHDFANVTLIVVLHIEDTLFLPDFRSSEKTFQILTQAAGRVGRGKYAGTIILQSFIKSHPVIELSLKQKTEEFLERELEQRAITHLPPFSRQILIEFSHVKEEQALSFMRTIKEEICHYWQEQKIPPQNVLILGPNQAPVPKMNNQFRYQISIQSAKFIHPKKLIPQSIKNNLTKYKSLKIDVDPYHFL